MRTLLATLAALAFLLAGCSDGGGKAADVPELGEGSQVDVGGDDVAGSGVIAGVVVDLSIRPIAGADVTLVEANATVTTGEDGLFAFRDVPAGAYVLRVSAPLFLPTQLGAESVAGEASDLQIVLAADPTPQPYHMTLKFYGRDEVGNPLVDFAADLFTNGTAGYLCDACKWNFTTEADWQTIVVEAVWEDSLPSAENATEFFWTLEGWPSGEYVSDYCYSPCSAFVGFQSDLAGDTSFALGMYPDEDSPLVYQQEWEVFVTVFYRAPAPEGWSFFSETE